MCRLSCVPASAFTAATASMYWLAVGVVVVLCTCPVVQVENKSLFGIGTRIVGDQLLLKDILQTPPIGVTEEPAIKFQYAIQEPITYLVIESDKNVFAKVKFSYELNMVEGIISSINDSVLRASKPEPFKVLIQIYGFNDTVLNIDPSYILNRDQQFNGVLKPIYINKIDQPLSLTEKDLKNLEEFDYDDDDDDDDDNHADADTEDADADADAGNEEVIDFKEDVFNSPFDKIIEQGQRQEGDFLVYESSQTSATTTKLPTNHSIIFYYVDIYYITYVKFIIYEHYLYNPVNSYENTYVVEYAHISPTTLKAIVTDLRTTSLYVQMQMYGFHPTALPVDYEPFLTNRQTLATKRPASSLTQLKILMNAQQVQNKNNSNNELQQQQLGHQISLDNNNNINCMQMQQVASASSSSLTIQRNFTNWSILKSIVIFVILTLMTSAI